MPAFLRKDDVKAQYQYVSELRSDLGEYEGLEPLIRDYEKWYQVTIRKNPVSWAIYGHDYFDESRRRVAAINQFIGQELPKSWVPADIPVAPPDTHLDKLSKILKVVGIGSVAAVGVVIWANSRRMGPPPSLRARNSNYSRFGRGAAL